MHSTTRPVGLFCLAIVAVSVSMTFDARSAHAQLFGERELGQTLSRRPSPGSAGQLEAANDAAQGIGPGAMGGELTGNERFLRQNRDVSDFVGSDLMDRPGFIGSVQGRTRGAIRSAITNLRSLADEQVNRIPPEPLQRRPQPYAPRLEIAFDYPTPTNSELAATIQRQMLKVPGMERLGSIEVSLEGRTAILRGAVATAHQRDVAAQLALLEPGVSQVQNELSILPAGYTPPPFEDQPAELPAPRD